LNAQEHATYASNIPNVNKTLDPAHIFLVFGGGDAVCTSCDRTGRWEGAIRVGTYLERRGGDVTGDEGWFRLYGEGPTAEKDTDLLAGWLGVYRVFKAGFMSISVALGSGMLGSSSVGPNDKLRRLGHSEGYCLIGVD